MALKICAVLFRSGSTTDVGDCDRVNVDAVDTVFAALKGFSPRDCVGAKHVGLGGLCLSLHKATTISPARSFEFLFYTIFYKMYSPVYTEQK